MLEGGVQKSRVVVRRRGAALVRRPIRRQDGRLVATETADVIAEERHRVVPALSERKKPINQKRRVIILLSNVATFYTLTFLRHRIPF